MVFPCCNKKLPAPLDNVETITCSCGQEYLPRVIIAYNEIIDIVTDWRNIVANGWAQIIAEPGKEHFIANLIIRGIKYAK